MFKVFYFLVAINVVLMQVIKINNVHIIKTNACFVLLWITQR